MRALRLVSPLLVSLFLVACPRPGEVTIPDPLAQPAAPSGSAARDLALSGFHALLVSGTAEDAGKRFDAALAKDAAEPYALVGRMYLEQRAARPDRALAAALHLLERSPRHPLASVAARLVLDLTGSAGPLDDEILSRGAKSLAAGATGDTAHLLRSAIANIHAQRGEAELLAKKLADMGTPDRFSLVGPLSAHSILEFHGATPYETTGTIEGGGQGALGTLALRELHFRDGRMSLEGESPYGDLYILSADVEVADPGVYTLRTVSTAAHRVHVDGTLLFERTDYARPPPTVQARAVTLSKGKHRILIKIAREHSSASLTVSLMRPDGRPAGLKFSAATGAAPHWKGVTAGTAENAYPSAEDLARALERETGATLAKYIAARDGMGRDREGAKRLAAQLGAHAKGAAVSQLRAELVEKDRTIPSRVARGRATRFLEEVLGKDPKHVAALLLRAELALDEQRPLDAAEYVKVARAAVEPVGYAVPMLEARLQLALNVDAQADRSAMEALELQPGLCHAIGLRYELARRRDAAALADQLVDALAQCPGSLARAAEHAKFRGDADRAVALYQQLVDRDPSQLGPTFQLASALATRQRYDDAIALLDRQWKLWPRHTQLPKRMAELEELAGRAARALELREAALAIDGSDLTLRRIVDRARTGKELLEEHAIDGREAIRAYEESRGDESSAFTMVLDASVLRVYPDGSWIERTHVIQKALEQGGIQEIAEVNIPGGAQVLALRTIKADGRVLEPETIENKDTFSLPGVQVGDYAEYEYLLAHPSRGPGQPGFTASSFYYQVANSPNHWSTYKVLAPKGSGLTVDAHNLTAPKVKEENGEEVFFHAERRVPPFIQEPNAPPSGNEYLPFVQVGSGARGVEGLIAAYADNQLDKARITWEVDEFAQQVAAGKKGLEAVKAIYAAVMQRLTGRDAGLGVSAASSLAQERGSRLWTLKAALEANGIPARLAVVRTFSVDPAPYLFPNDSLLPYICLRADVPGGESVWLDPLVRYGPFGVLPEQARDREAILLPEPGRPGATVRTPKGGPEAAKKVVIHAALSDDGVLEGSAEETYLDFDAAQIGEALEQMSPQQRDQALQGALSRYFGGAQLSDLEVDFKREVGAPLVVRYRFRAPNFARREGNALVMGALTFPAQLGRRYVQLGSRRTPLYIGNSEAGRTEVTLTLPEGSKLRGALDKPFERKASFGSYRRSEKLEGRVLRVEEDYRLELARIPPSGYDAFAGFAGDVDLAQARDLAVVR